MQHPNAHTHARRLLLFLQVCATATAVVRRSARNTAASGGAATYGSAIEPTLRPASDRKFFRGDYPYDSSPTAEHNLDFGHPYPVVQDSRAYDRDFVSDENTDSGEWKAQEKYDHLRIKYEHDKNDTLTDLERQKKPWRHMDAAKASEAAAERVSEDAETNTTEAKRRLEEAQHEVDELVGHSSGRAKGGKIGEAVGDVNHEVKDVEACERELARAKAKLKKLQEERAAYLREWSTAQKEAADAKAKAEARYERLKDAEFEKLDKELVKTAAQRQKEHDEAWAQYRMSEAELVHLEADIKSAAEGLRDARRSEDSSGGIYYRRSAAHRVAGTLAPVALVAMSCMLQLVNVL